MQKLDNDYLELLVGSKRSLGSTDFNKLHGALADDVTLDDIIHIMDSHPEMRATKDLKMVQRYLLDLNLNVTGVEGERESLVKYLSSSIFHGFGKAGTKIFNKGNK